MMMISLLVLVAFLQVVLLGVAIGFRGRLNSFSKESFIRSFQDLFSNQFRDNQQYFSREFSQLREEIHNHHGRLQQGLTKTLSEMSTFQKNQLELFSKQLTAVTQSSEKRMESLQESVEKRLQTLQQDNNQKLEQMRKTVDEKLHDTLEKRLGDSFKIVSERLETVQKGLGEMQQLASGVGDLKRVLSNVKTRGVWGEIQCATLLEQVLSPDQYRSQVSPKPGSSDLVDFAIKLPGKDTGSESVVWLPIDAKFPLENYQQLVEAQELGDKELVQKASKQLEMQIKKEAKSIQEKYVSPPDTTDFAILYLPTEGLYAEVLRLPGLQDVLQSKYKVLISGPTTLAALLNSLQMGFKTLAIEKQSSEVWKILSAVKTEFNKFTGILDKTQKKLQEAGNIIDTASRKTRTIERKLRTVEELPTEESQLLFEKGPGFELPLTIASSDADSDSL